MPVISIKGTTGVVKSRREGANVIVEKQIDAIITEKHVGIGKRLIGKHRPILTLSAEDVKGFDANTEAKLRAASQYMNDQTNKYGAALEKKHKEEVKKMTQRVKAVA
mgnify:FL=1